MIRQLLAEVMAKPSGDLHERTTANGPPIAAPETDAAFGAVQQVADAVPRVARMSVTPVGMIVRQQTFLFNLMLDALQTQRRFFHIWRPRHR